MLRLGRVIEVDLGRAMVRVAVGDIETHWIEIGTARAGATRIWSPPSAGEQVILFCPDGDVEAAFPFGALYSDEFPAPGNSARELIHFADGTVIAYDPESHHLEAILGDGGQVTITAPGGITINGDITLNGKLTASDDVLAGGVSLKSHKHVGVQAGSAMSGKPA